ncbi:MAG: hypothetical protein KBS64_08125 [Treponema sp.]|nr:hypothetical protein [Candidatus Treponema equi]
MADKKDTSAKIKKELKDFFDSSLEASKKGLKKAGIAISEFGDTSVIKIDITKYKVKLEKKYEELGKLCAKLLIDEKKASFAKKDEDVAALLESIKQLKDKVAAKEKELKAHNKKEASAKKGEAKKPAAKKTVKKETATKKAVKKAPAKKGSSDKTIVAK